MRRSPPSTAISYLSSTCTQGIPNCSIRTKSLEVTSRLMTVCTLHIRVHDDSPFIQVDVTRMQCLLCTPKLITFIQH
ncbi:hypothetical protein BDR04DRAFT_374222 [Suillus decipiens]|nr:hypothetical protein BDR04DRAFT_374222 [Suillus decipiens]